MSKQINITKSSKMPPCRTCKTRHEACHDECEKYKGWVSQVKEIQGKDKYGNLTNENWGYNRKFKTKH